MVAPSPRMSTRCARGATLRMARCVPGLPGQRCSWTGPDISLFRAGEEAEAHGLRSPRPLYLRGRCMFRALSSSSPDEYKDKRGLLGRVLRESKTFYTSARRSRAPTLAQPARACHHREQFPSDSLPACPTPRDRAPSPTSEDLLPHGTLLPSTARDACHTKSDPLQET